MKTQRMRRGTLGPAILKYIRRNPGANATHISEYLNRNVTNALHTLTKEGKLTRRWKSGPVGERGYVYWEVEDKPDVVTIADLPTAPDRDELYARINAQQAEIDDLHTDIAALEAWEADAIAQHPDLAPPVHPLVLKARQIAADYARSGGDLITAEDVMAGNRDHTHLVLVALAALRAQQPAQEA